MRTYIEIILLEYIFSLILIREFLLCAHGWAGQTQLPDWRRISRSEIRNSAAAEKNWRRGRDSNPRCALRHTRFLPKLYFLKAEGARFELAIPCGILAFQASALGHYAIPPSLIDKNTILLF